ncbi:MAG: DUF5067 domain-containing protein [Oscillospiraceae bacterium]|nr:DUF5067 domain-containing protein [Oscillospiraceae bacterium]
MKKTAAFLTVLVMALSMTACDNKDSSTDKPESSNNSAATTPVSEDSKGTEKPENDALTHTFTQYGNVQIKIVGAEAAKNNKGDNLLRVYYDYTNTDDTANGHYPNSALEFLSITQDGAECKTYDFKDDDENVLPEDLNKELCVQPGCTNRNTFNIYWNPNGGTVKVSCYIMIGNWGYSEDDVESFTFEIDPKNLMGVPEPFELPVITNPTYTADMSASGEFGFTQFSMTTIKGVELAKDKDGRDLVQVILSVTNNRDEEATAAFMTGVTLFQDGVGLPSASYWDVKDEDVVASNKAYNIDQISPGETVECSALFYPRTKSPVEAVIENVNTDKRLGACFDLQSLYDAAEAEAKAEADAAQSAADAAAAADKATMEAIVGTWVSTGDWPDRVTFNQDLTGVYDLFGDLDPFTYTVKDGVLHLIYDDGSEVDYKVSISGNDLVLTDTFQDELPYTRASAE